MKWLLMSMVAVGTVLLMVSMYVCRGLYRVVPPSLKFKWRILTLLICLFIVGYFGYLLIQFFNIDFPLEILISIIFLGGALFVYGILSLAHHTLYALKELNDTLENEVNKRTRELNESNRSLLASQDELARQNSFLRSVINALPHPFYVIDSSTYEIILANTASSITLAGTPQTCHLLTHGSTTPCHGKAHPCPVIDIRNTGKPVIVEHLHLNSKGEERIVEVHGYPVLNDSGALQQVIEYSIDITEKKQIEKDLIKAKIIAEAANSAKGEFLANMSHEIRTPMNAILGMAHLALQTELDEQQRDYINKVYFSANNLLQILNDILDVSKIEAGRFELVEAPFQLADLMGGVADTMNIPATAKGLALSVTTQQELPHSFIGDDMRLRQILLNLVGNAIKFTPSGSVHVHVGTENSVGGQEKIPLTFSVSDTGIGIAPQKLDVIFDSFEQGDSSHARQYGGTGLGLSICRHLITLMGGRIWVENRAEGGSAFHFTVPLSPCSEKQARVGLLTDEELETQSAGLRILLVDDNEINREVARMMLEKNHLVTTATNGLEALTTLAPHDFDIILMDIQMPELDGLAACSIIRSLEQGISVRQELPEELRTTLANKLKGRHAAIIAMTAHAMEEDKERCMAAGMDGYISKPFQYRQLLSAFKSIRENQAESNAVQV